MSDVQVYEGDGKLPEAELRALAEQLKPTDAERASFIPIAIMRKDTPLGVEASLFTHDDALPRLKHWAQALSLLEAAPDLEQDLPGSYQRVLGYLRRTVPIATRMLEHLHG